MRKLKIAGILALCAFAPMLMAPTGGFPSRPRLQQVTMVGSAQEKLSVRTDANGAAGVGYLAFRSNDGATRLGYIGDASNANTDIWLLTDSGNIRLVTQPGGDIAVSTDGGSSYVNMRASGISTRHAYAQLTAGGSCSIDATRASSGVSACGRSSTGVYTVTLNAGFTDEPTCSISPVSTAGATSVGGESSSTTNVNVRSYNTAGAAVDVGGFSVNCVGP